MYTVTVTRHSVSFLLLFDGFLKQDHHMKDPHIISYIRTNSLMLLPREGVETTRATMLDQFREKAVIEDDLKPQARLSPTVGSYLARTSPNRVRVASQGLFIWRLMITRIVDNTSQWPTDHEYRQLLQRAYCNRTGIIRSFYYTNMNKKHLNKKKIKVNKNKYYESIKNKYWMCTEIIILKPATGRSCVPVLSNNSRQLENASTLRSHLLWKTLRFRTIAAFPINSARLDASVFISTVKGKGSFI